MTVARSAVLPNTPMQPPSGAATVSSNWKVRLAPVAAERHDVGPTT